MCLALGVRRLACDAPLAPHLKIERQQVCRSAGAVLGTLASPPPPHLLFEALRTSVVVRVFLFKARAPVKWKCPGVSAVHHDLPGALWDSLFSGQVRFEKCCPPPAGGCGSAGHRLSFPADRQAIVKRCPLTATATGEASTAVECLPTAWVNSCPALCTLCRAFAAGWGARWHAMHLFKRLLTGLEIWARCLTCNEGLLEGGG